MSRRTGFTLIELLVTMAVVAVLAGLTLAAVQRVRAAAARVACANNLRQLAVAAQNYHAAHHRLPAGVRGRFDPQPFMTWGTALLPYLEQSAAWAEAEEDYRRQPVFTLPVPHRNLARPLPVFRCPADARAVGTTDDGITAAFTYYLGLSGSAGVWHDGVLFQDSRVRVADLTDGASNTLLAGERPPSPDNRFGWWYAGIGQSPLDGSADSVMAAQEYNRTFYAPTCPRGPYQFGPGDPDDMCDTFHFWSRHAGGAHFAFCDGSVRFLRYDAAPILPALATRAGGETVSAPD